MANGKGGYVGIDNYVVNLILAIIPITSWLLGGITRIQRGHVIAGIVQLVLAFTFLGGLFFWITDIIGWISKKDFLLWAD